MRGSVVGAHPVVRRTIGLDGCPTGWVAVTMEDGALVSVEVVDAIAPLLAASAPRAIGIDMPVGLVDAPRDTDAAARALLPGRASSVFNTPPLGVVEAVRRGEVTTHAQASALTARLTGVGLSQQAWRLVPKIIEVDDLAALAASSMVPLSEVHPELAFATIVGEPLPRKRSWPGMTLRRRVLAGLGIDLPDRFPNDDRAAPDDVLDAAVCAWVADGIAQDLDIVTVPASTDQWAHGRAIVIHARRAPAGSERRVGPG